MAILQAQMNFSHMTKTAPNKCMLPDLGKLSPFLQKSRQFTQAVNASVMPMSKIRNLIIIIPIILTSGAVVFYYFCPLHLVNYRTDRARYGDIQTLESAIMLFRIDVKRLPTTEEGLNVLTTKPENPPSNWRQYLDRLPKDPWGNEYIYKQEIHQEVDFVIYSKGPDGLDNHGAHDDVVN